VKKCSLQLSALRQIFVAIVFVTIFALANDARAQVPVSFSAGSKYNGQPVTLSAELFMPGGKGPFPAVVLMHGCGGLKSAARQSLRTHARYLVANKFASLIVDSFGPRKNSGGWVCNSFERLRHARSYRTKDAYSALKYLKSLRDIDQRNLFLMGQSNGGSVAIKIARKNGFRAVVAYYPWCGMLDNAASNSIISPLLIFGGELDHWVSPHSCKRRERKIKNLQVIIYPAAVHSFDLNIKIQRYAGHLVGYNRHATTDSRSRMVAFFKKYISR